MSRNAESHFALNPTNADISRSRFDRPSDILTSFNVGDIVPFYVDEVLPGDTHQIDTSKLIRLQTLITPMMGNLYLDTYYFFVPNRLVWSHWKNFMGENTESAWIPKTEYSVPQIKPPAGGWNVGTIADYMGVPVGVDNISVSALPFRAYALIMNDWFRDENLCDPVNVPVDDTTVTGVNTGDFPTDVCLGGLPYKAAKFHDYFSACLPSPQKSADVQIPVAEGQNLPVVPLAQQVTLPSDATGMLWKTTAGSTGSDFGVKSSGSNWNPSTSYTDPSANALISNLWAIQTGDVTAATINQLRIAFQIQKLYERDARGGTRYIEVLKSHFGVTSPDARLQRPEYLGGNRVPISINQVIQQSGTAEGTTPQGNVAGMSQTTDFNSDFTHSFVEHGFIIGVMVVRYQHSYQQGIERFWSRKTRFDYYWPVFANIGEQAVLNKEIYAAGTAEDDEVFGYQEAWADYRYKPSRVSGEMRSVYAQSLDSWHLADDYSTLPKLSPTWIMEDKANVDRVLAVQSTVSNQLFGDIYVQNRTTRPMPMYSVPGLIDHH